jgi:hypothetical protein
VEFVDDNLTNTLWEAGGMAIDVGTQKWTWLSGVPHELRNRTNFSNELEYAAFRSRTGLESPNFGDSLRMTIIGSAP